MISVHHPERRVVITGLGVVSPLGTGVDAFWQALAAGRSGITRLSDGVGDPRGAPYAGVASNFEGRVEEFGNLDDAPKKSIRKSRKIMNRETRMGVCAAWQAMANADLRAGSFDPDRIGVCFGAGNVAMQPEDFVSGVEACCNEKREFDFSSWGARGLPQMNPLWMLTCLPNMPACHLAMHFDLRGPNNSITQREAAANIAVAEACYNILDDAADVMVAGGAGTTIVSMNMLHTLQGHDVSLADADPEKICRPFDRERTGSVLGEGAAAVILEDLAGAQRRNAKIYAEVLGVGSSCVVDRALAPRCSLALANAIESALEQAQLSPESIGHIHAHGLSTSLADAQEAHAIEAVLGRRARQIPLVAAKSAIGNSGGGAGALELVASLLALEHGHLFPVLNFEHPDPDCPVCPVASHDVPAGDVFLNLNFSPEGHASAVVVRRWE